MMKAPNQEVLRPKRAFSSRRIDENFGCFVHFVPKLTLDNQGSLTTLESASKLDLKSLVNSLVAFGVQYLRFTAWHKEMIPLYPSQVMEKWRGKNAIFERDLIGELINALRPHGIKLQIYTHPRDGHDFNQDDQIKTGWGDTSQSEPPNPSPRTFKFNKWNTFVEEAYSELLEKYGSDISAIYLDEGTEFGDSEWVVDYPRLRKLFDKYPHITVIQNFYGNIYQADIADHEYGRWGEFESKEGSKWPSFEFQSVSTVLGSTWWAANSSTDFKIGYKFEDLYRYLVIQISTSKVGGGVAFAAGPLSPSGWETGVEDCLVSIGKEYSKRQFALKNGSPSSRWPTPDEFTFENLSWGVAVEVQGRTFLHILKVPSNGIVVLPPTKDSSILVSAMTCVQKRTLDVSKDSKGNT